MLAKKAPKPIVIDRYKYKQDVQGYLLSGRHSYIYLFDIATKSFDRLTTTRATHEVWRDGKLEREEVHVMRERWMFPTELRLMLETAGDAADSVIAHVPGGDAGFVNPFTRTTGVVLGSTPERGRVRAGR